MAYPVRVYKKHPAEGGKVRKVITTAQLWKRFNTKVQLEASAELSNGPMLAKDCAACGSRFFTHDARSKYCPGSCSVEIKKAQDKASGLRRRDKRRAKKELVKEEVTT